MKGKPLEFFLLFSVFFLLVNKIFYFLPHFNSWFLTNWSDLPELQGEASVRDGGSTNLG